MKVIVAALASLIAGSAAAGAVTVQPHRAVYDLTLDTASSRSTITGADGRMVFEIDGSACEGWTVNFRMVTQYLRRDADPRIVDTQSTSFEAGNSLELQYNDHDKVNGKPEGEQRVRATRSAPGSEIEGEYGVGAKTAFKLPPETLFPVQHQLRVTAEAEQGTTRDVSVLFDGSNAATAYKVITFINGKKGPGQNSADAANEAAARLSGNTSWPVSMSYFKLGGEEQETPDYQVSFNLYDNGVATGLTLDYGDHALKGELKQLEYLPVKPCN